MYVICHFVIYLEYFFKIFLTAEVFMLFDFESFILFLSNCYNFIIMHDVMLYSTDIPDSKVASLQKIDPFVNFAKVLLYTIL